VLATNISIIGFGTESFKMIWNWSDTFRCSSDICYVCKNKVLILLNIHTNFSNVICWHTYYPFSATKSNNR